MVVELSKGCYRAVVQSMTMSLGIEVQGAVRREVDVCGRGWGLLRKERKGHRQGGILFGGEMRVLQSSGAMVLPERVNP